jgi:hypothetical protein
VQVDHGQRRQHVGLDDPPVGDHHAEVGADVEGVVDPVGRGDAEVERGLLDRRRHEGRAPAAALVGLRDDEGDLEAGVDQRPERRGGERGRAEEGEAPGVGGGGSERHWSPRLRRAAGSREAAA